MKTYKVLRPMAGGRYLVQLGRDDFDHDPRGESILVEFDDESRTQCYIAAIVGGNAALVVPM